MRQLLIWLDRIINKHKALKRWKRIVTVLAAIITFATTYALILPAITVEKNQVGEVSGMYLERGEDPDEMLEDNALLPEDAEISADNADEEADAATPWTDAPTVKMIEAAGDDYTVTLTYDATSGIPEGAALDVSEIAQDSEDYQIFLEESKKAMGLTEEDTLPNFAARFFDIKIMVGDEEFKPESGVSVEITYEEPLAENPDTEVNAVHFANDNAEAEMISANTTEVQEGGTATVEFTAESFSVYGVIYTDAQLKKTVIAASGESYEITVTYGADAEIPDGAELIVEEVLPGDKEYQKNCKAAEKALRAEYDEGLSAHTVDFDISIVFEGETIEPASNSTVSVEIRLVGDAFSDEDTVAENAEQRTEDELIEEGFALYNGAEYEAEGLNNVQSANVIHIKEDSADIIELSDTPSIQDGQLVLKFETDSFSDYIVTGSTSGGENYTVDGLPSVIYVGDTINLFWTQYSINYNLNGHATERSWEDRYSISGRNYAKGVVIQATSTGWITVGNKNIEIRPKPAGSHPSTVTTVPNASIGVKMNMFDYDLNNTLDDYFNQFNLVRQPYESTFKNAGVNRNKTLKFWGSGINTDWYGNDDRTRADVVWSKNEYTQNDPGLNIVQSNLSGGYPILNGDGNQSLSYLFTDSNYNNDVKAYLGVDGLFQKDDKGYYYYDSGQNYAWLNPETKVFEVYGGTYHQWSKGEVSSQFIPGQYDNGKPVTVGDNGRAIGYFPFHEWDPEHDKFVNWDKGLNHHFGLSMDLQFSFPDADDGQAIVDENGQEIVFEFNGDDDMWVFIDGKLCMDIGGIHQPIDGKIDFTNRSVTVAGSSQNSFSSSNWNALFDGEEHTLKVFYLERGGCDSNCKIKFNLTQYTDVELDKVDKDDTTIGLEGAKFQLFKEEEVIEGGEIVTKLVPAYWYAKDTSNPNNNKGVKKPFIETSDEDGHVLFKNVPLGNYVLKEIAAPPGYKLITDVRSVPIYLTEENGSTVVKYRITGEDADDETNGMQIGNEKIEPMDISFEKEWNDNGDTTPPAGAKATFALKRIQKKPLKRAKVILQYANGTTIASEEELCDGDEVCIDDYRIKTSVSGRSSYDGEEKSVTGTARITLGGSEETLELTTTTTYVAHGEDNGWWGYSHRSWEETSSASTPVTYTVNTEHADANGAIILKLNKNANSFDTPPTTSARIGTPVFSNEEETVTVTTFTLPDDADPGETWKKTFPDLPKTDAWGRPYEYFIVETGKTGADAYTSSIYTSAAGSEENPMHDSGDVEITNKTPEPEPDPIDLEADNLPDAKSDKVLTPNNDGTYTLTLSVEIPQYKNKSKDRANVVVVYDSSNSMNRALGYRRVSRWSDPVFGRINNEGENWDQVYEAWQPGWRYTIYDRNLKDWVEYNAAWGFWVPDEDAGTRMTKTQDIVRMLGSGLLDNNKPGEKPGEETVQIAFVEYATNVLHVYNPTADYGTFDDWVGDCEAPGTSVNDPLGATNWEAALAAANGISFGDDDPTYIIFMSDGNPTKRNSSIDGDPDDKADTYVAGTHGNGTNDDPCGYNLQAANQVAQQIDRDNKILYAFGVYGEAEKMRNLVPRDAYYDVTDPDNLEALFEKLVTLISSRVGYTDVVIEDGITSLTSSTLVSGTAQNFTYKVTDKDGNDVTEEYLGKLGNPEASYVETDKVSEGGIPYKQKEVVWNLGHEDILLEGGTYSVSFIVWPSQEAYDLAADLNNGLRQFSELNDVEASQVEYVGGVYKVKTNTHESAKGKTAKQIDDGPVTPTPDEYKDIPMEKHVDPMPLTDTTVKIRKKWKAAIDKTQLADINDHTVQLELDKDNVKYIDGITISAPQPISVPSGSEWIWPEYVKDPVTGAATSEEAVHHISAGLMVSTAAAEESNLNVEGYPTATFTDSHGETTTYHILESGRDYAFKEVGESDYRFELKEQKFHPMVVNDRLCDVTFSDDKRTIISMTEAAGNTVNLTAENELKGGIRIYKEVYKEDEKTRINDDETMFEVTVNMTNPPTEEEPEGSAYAVTADNGGFRIMYGSMRPEDDKEYGSAEAGDNTVALTAEEIAYNRSRNRSQRYGISGGEFTAQIYPDEYIQVANVSRGVTYEVSETPVDGYVNFAIEYKIDGESNTDDPKTMTSDQSHQVIVKNKKLPPPTIDITVRKVDKDNVANMSAATLPGATFTLEKYTTSEYQNKDPEWTEQSKEESDNAAGIFSFTDLTEGYYQLVETVCPKGYVRTSSNPRFRVKKEGTELKIYIVRADGQEVLQTEMLKIENQSINVGNEPGAALPATGGPGTRLFTIIGAVLFAGAGILLMKRRLRTI